MPKRRSPEIRQHYYSAGSVAALYLRGNEAAVAVVQLEIQHNGIRPMRVK